MDISGVQPSRPTFRAERRRGGIDEKLFCFQLADVTKMERQRRMCPVQKTQFSKRTHRREKGFDQKPAKGGSQHFFYKGTEGRMANHKREIKLWQTISRAGTRPKWGEDWHTRSGRKEGRKEGKKEGGRKEGRKGGKEGRKAQ